MPGLGLSNQFNPGVEDASSAGIGISAAPYSGDSDGIAQSCAIIAEKIRLGSQDPRVLGWGDDKLHAAGLDGRNQPTALAKATVLLNALRAQTVYRYDPPGTEMIQPAVNTLCLGPGLCIKGGDCDDMVVALGSVLCAQSIPTYVVKQFYGSEHQQHVLIGILVGDAPWYLDPSTIAAPTQTTRAVEETWFDPLDYRGVTGTSGAEIVTLGRPIEMMLGFVPNWDDSTSDSTGLAAAPGTLQATGPYAHARVDLNNQVGVVIDAGDAYANAVPPEYSNAVQAYMAAGQAGATSVGPEIDLAGSPNITQPLTQRAWVTNQKLQSAGQAALSAAGAPAGTPANAPDQIPTTTPDTSRPNLADAQLTQALAKEMFRLYSEAITAGELRPNTLQGPGASPLTSSKLPYILGGIAAVLGGVLWARHRVRGRR